MNEAQTTNDFHFFTKLAGVSFGNCQDVIKSLKVKSLFIEKIKPGLDKFSDVSKWGKPTFFEVYTLLAFLYFDSIFISSVAISNAHIDSDACLSFIEYCSVYNLIFLFTNSDAFLTLPSSSIATFKGNIRSAILTFMEICSFILFSKT